MAIAAGRDAATAARSDTAAVGRESAAVRRARTSGRLAWDAGVSLWLGLSVAYAVLLALPPLLAAFAGEHVVQDDARQFVFWMQRFSDPALFPNDLIADYFQSVSPPGYSALFRVAALAGLDPVTFSKLLPPLLAVAATVFGYLLFLRVLPVPWAGFVAAVLLNQTLWMNSALASATPRAFAEPLLLALLYFLARRALVPVLLSVALLGTFYPQVLLVGAAVLALRVITWDGRAPRLSRDRRDLLVCACGLATALVVLLPFALQSSAYGPVITAAEARANPEFLPGGRSVFFLDDPLEFLLYGQRSGVLPTELGATPTPYHLWIGLLLPLVLLLRARLPLAAQVTAGVRLVPELLVASAATYAAAYALLFQLHLPNRYTSYSLRIALAIAATIVLAVLLDASRRWASRPARLPRLRRTAAAAAVGAIVLWTTVYPLLVGPQQGKFYQLQYRAGGAARLYEFLRAQPPDVLIASLDEEVDFVPVFAGRSILVGFEYSIPYHLGYYRPFTERVTALMLAQYSPDLSRLQGFLRAYRVTYVLLDPTELRRDTALKDAWLAQFETVTGVQSSMKAGAKPVLDRLVRPCTVLQDGRLYLIDAACILIATPASVATLPPFDKGEIEKD